MKKENFRRPYKLISIWRFVVVEVETNLSQVTKCPKTEKTEKGPCNTFTGHFIWEDYLECPIPIVIKSREKARVAKPKIKRGQRKEGTTK